MRFIQFTTQSELNALSHYARRIGNGITDIKTLANLRPSSLLKMAGFNTLDTVRMTGRNTKRVCIIGLVNVRSGCRFKVAFPHRRHPRASFPPIREGVTAVESKDRISEEPENELTQFRCKPYTLHPLCK